MANDCLVNFNIPLTGKNNAIELVNLIKDFICKNNCPNLSMDISNLNIMDASKVTMICSTYHWAKYPDGEISWYTKSPEELKELINPLNLENIRLINAQ